MSVKNRHFLQWRPQDVGDWLHRNGLSDYAERFIDEEVSGRSLLGLTQTMIAILIPKIGRQAEFNYILDLLKSENVECASGFSPSHVQTPRISSSAPNHPRTFPTERKTRVGPVPILLTPAILRNEQISVNDQPNSNDSHCTIRTDDGNEDLRESPNSSVMDTKSEKTTQQNTSDDSSDLQGPIQFSLNRLADEMFDYDSFILSDLSSYVLQSIATSDWITLPQLVKNQMIRSIHAQMKKVSMYPTREQYVHAAKAVVARFPSLADNTASGYDSWARSIRDRFKNQRRGLSDNPLVLERQIRYRLSHGRSMDGALQEDEGVLFGDGEELVYDGRPTKAPRLDPEDMEEVDSKVFVHQALSISELND